MAFRSRQLTARSKSSGRGRPSWRPRHSGKKKPRREPGRSEPSITVGPSQPPPVVATRNVVHCLCCHPTRLHRHPLSGRPHRAATNGVGRADLPPQYCGDHRGVPREPRPCPACKTVYAGSIPAVASTSFPRLIRPKAGRSGILPGRWRVTDGSSRRGPTGQFMLPCDIDFAAMRETTVFMLVYQSYMKMEQEQACPGDQK